MNREASPSHRAARASLVAALALIGACQQPEPHTANNQDAVEIPTLNLPAAPRPEPHMDRAAILAAVAQAASAAASGANDAASQGALDGRQFEFRIRFGCRGPSSRLRDEWLGWSYDRDEGTLRVRAMPTLSADEQLVKALGGDQFEAVEGFWIPRPWLLQPACPAAAKPVSEPSEPARDADSERIAARPTETAAVAEPIPSWPRIGIAQFFTDTDPRTGRRSMRPYEAVKTIDSTEPVGSQGFNLVLSGRLEALPGKRVIACEAKGANSPPECVVSAQFDRVWIERPGAREPIAEWGGG